jgi:hypothetical protein
MHYRSSANQNTSANPFIKSLKSESQIIIIVLRYYVRSLDQSLKINFHLAVHRQNLNHLIMTEIAVFLFPAQDAFFASLRRTTHFGFPLLFIRRSILNFWF